MKSDEKLYFIALIPKGKVYEEAMEWKKLFESEYGSKASLNSDPHITLHMPFRYRDKKKGLLLDTLQKIASNQRPFIVVLNGFGSFPPRTIFIDLDESLELIKLQSNLKTSFKRKLKLLNADYKDQAFKPHITLAFRDLKKNQFELAWELFKDKKYQQPFEVKSLFLLRHNSKKWEMEQEFKFINKA